jgi:hypothetical protein
MYFVISYWWTGKLVIGYWGTGFKKAVPITNFPIINFQVQQNQLTQTKW